MLDRAWQCALIAILFGVVYEKQVGERLLITFQGIPTLSTRRLLPGQTRVTTDISGMGSGAVLSGYLTNDFTM